MSHADKIIDLIKSLEKTSLALCQWLDHKILKSNPDICHLLISSNENVTIHVGKYEIENSEKLLGVELDWKLTFEDPISDVCRKASGKLNASARIAQFIGLFKKRILMNAFFNSQFSYCPLIWMCQCRRNNTKIKKLHERYDSHRFQKY